MKKKQQVVKLIVTMLLLVVLVGGYVAMTVFTPAEEETEEETDETFTVTTVEEDDIKKIVYTRNDSEIALERKKDDWVSPTDTKCPVNNYTVDSMLSALKEVKASRKIEKEDVDEDAFGLKKPKCVITFTTKDGKETTYTLGALNSVVDKYYFKMTGDDNVYLIDTTMYNSFDYDLLGLAELEEYPSIGNQDIADYSLTMDGKTLYFVDSKDAAHKKNDSEIPECVWTYGTDKGNLKEQDSDTAGNMVQAILGLTNSGCVTYDKTEKDLEKYGLDHPKMTLTVNYTEMESADEDSDDSEDTEESKDADDSKEEDTVKEAKILDRSFTVYFGNTDKDSGEYYVYSEGSNAIYTMNVSGVETLMKAFKEK